LTFTVVRLAAEQLDLPKPPPSRLALVDGGVYDNLGLEWFQGSGSGRPASAALADFILVINASAVLPHRNSGFGAARAIMRDLNVQYSQTLNLRVRWFVDHLLHVTGRGLYVGINRDPRRYTLADNRTPIDSSFYEGALPSALAARVPLVRTDLDRFSLEETALLAYHGYWSLHARLMTFHPDLATPTPQWREFADLSSVEERHLAEVLDAAALVRLTRRTSRGA